MAIQKLSDSDSMLKPVKILLEHGSDTFPDIDISEEDKELVDFVAQKEIEITPTKNGLRISIGRYIGSVEFSKFILTVNPKFTNINNIGKLIDYASGIKDENIIDYQIKFEEEKNQPMEFIILLFVLECHKLLRRGLSKSYVVKQDLVPFLRGKLLMRQQLQNEARYNLKFACEFDEFTSNNLENQILLYCLEKCYNLTESRVRKEQIRRIIHQMDSEVELRTIENEDFRKITYTRLNQNYKKPHILAELILRHLGLLSFKKQRTPFVVPYFVPMYQVFEDFLTHLFDEYYDLPIKGQVNTNSWRVDDRVVPIRPDIISYNDRSKKRGSEVSIIDAKYMPESKFGEDKEHYQIAFYLNEYNRKVGYAILPKDKNEKRKLVKWEAPNQDLTIFVKFIDIDETLDWIYSRDDMTKDIKKMIHELVPL